MGRQSYIIADPMVFIDDEGRNAKIGQSCRYLESAVTGAEDEDRRIAIIEVYFSLASVLPALLV